MEDMMEEKTGVQFSKIIVSLIVVLNICFTIYVLQIFKVTGVEPVTLITAFFAFTTGELWMTASIKKSKVKRLKRGVIDEGKSDIDS
jgi:hypothetical protein